MKNIIIIRGNSGSGKTTVAKQLQKELGNNVLLLSQDTIRRDMLNVKDGFDSPTIPMLIKLVEYGFENNETVIVEGILNSKWYASLFDKILELYGEKVYSYYYDIPFEETVKRHNSRNKAKEFGEDTLRRWWNEKDYLSQIKETPLYKDISVNDAVSLILANLQRFL